MLEKVSLGISAMTRNVVIHHPNCFNCLVYKQQITRKGQDEFSDIPTLGGLGVLDEDDEVEYEYAYAGDGYALPVEQFEPSPMMDHNDANLGPLDEFRFIIFPAAQSGEEGFFEVSTHDIVMLLLGMEEDSPKLAFEVVGRETTTNIPPYNIRFICNRRDDLHIKLGGKLLNP